jgi:hypothetical protein
MTEIKKRYMACVRCRGTSFEVYQEEIINEHTQDEIKGFSFTFGSHGVTRLRCLSCGLENSTVGIF